MKWNTPLSVCIWMTCDAHQSDSRITAFYDSYFDYNSTRADWYSEFDSNVYPKLWFRFQKQVIPITVFSNELHSDSDSDSSIMWFPFSFQFQQTRLWFWYWFWKLIPIPESFTTLLLCSIQSLIEIKTEPRIMTYKSFRWLVGEVFS